MVDESHESEDYNTLLRKFAECKTMAKAQVGLLRKDLENLRSKNASLHNLLVWREIQIDWVARNFPEIRIPEALATAPVPSLLTPCLSSRNTNLSSHLYDDQYSRFTKLVTYGERDNLKSKLKVAYREFIAKV